MFHSYGFKDSVISQFYLPQVPGVSVMKFPEFEDIPMPYDSKRNKFQAFLLCHGSCEFFFLWRKQGRWIWFLTSLIFGNNNFHLCYKMESPISLGFCIFRSVKFMTWNAIPKKILGFFFVFFEEMKVPLVSGDPYSPCNKFRRWGWCVTWLPSRSYHNPKASRNGVT